MILTVRVFEAEGEIIVRKANLPSGKNLVHQGFMDTLKCCTDKIVGSNGLADGEEHMSDEPRVAIGRFLKSVVNNPCVLVVLDVLNRRKVVDQDENAAKHRRRGR